MKAEKEKLNEQIKMRPVHFKKFCKGELDREEGNVILIGELSGMRLAPTNRAACKRCGTKFEKGELCKSR